MGCHSGRRFGSARIGRLPFGYLIAATATTSTVDANGYSLRPQSGFLLSQAGQRLFVAAIFGISARLVYPPRSGGWVFFGPFALVTIAASIYALAVGLMALRMRLTVANGEISYLEYFKPRSAAVNQVSAFQLAQRRGRYGPGLLEGRVLGANGAPILHGIAMGAFDAIDMLRLASSIHKPIEGDAEVVVDNWLRPRLRRRLGSPEPELPFAPGEVSKHVDALRSQRASGRLEIKCPSRTIQIDFIRGRALRTRSADEHIRECPRGTSRYAPLALESDVINAFAQTLKDPSYYMEV